MKVIFVFYRNFLVPSIAISCLIGTFVRDGSGSEIMTAFWAKLVVSALLGLFFGFFRLDKFYFFENLGFTKQRLYAGALTIDLTLWIIIIGFIQLLS